MQKLWVVVAVLGLLSFPVAAGTSEGPRVHSDTVLANRADRYQETFRADEEAIVIVRSVDVDDDVDVEVFDENGNKVRSDYTTSGRVILRWEPKWTGCFTIRIINCESHDVPYVLGLN